MRPAAPLLLPVVLPTAGLSPDLGARERVMRQRTSARTALFASAARSRAELGALAQDERGAPLASNGWHWSLSHVRSRVAGVVARAPVGIDVERVQPRRSELVRAVTSHEELQLFGGFDWRAFARTWTAKEAVLKKAGCGLAELSACRVLAVPDGRRLLVAHRGRAHVVHQVTVADEPHGSGAVWVVAVTVDQDAEVRWCVERAPAPSEREGGRP